MPLSSGTRIGPYEISTLLGKGGMGEVYRARDSRLHRDVAVKTLPAGLAEDPNRMAQRSESSAAGACKELYSKSKAFTK